MTIWFTADTHFGHDNIIRFCNRPFKDWREMNDVLAENYNNCVGVNDTVYHLGDFAFMSQSRAIEMIKRLNGKKYFLAGNHDKPLFKRDSDFRIEVRPDIEPYLEWVKDYHEMTIQDKTVNRKNQMIVLGHYAKRIWNKSHWGAWSLYGHSHGTLPDDPNALSIDVGVDAVAKHYAVNGIINPSDYRPISYVEIKGIMASKKFLSIDHHGRR